MQLGLVLSFWHEVAIGLFVLLSHCRELGVELDPVSGKIVALFAKFLPSWSGTTASLFVQASRRSQEQPSRGQVPSLVYLGLRRARLHRSKPADIVAAALVTASDICWQQSHQPDDLVWLRDCGVQAVLAELEGFQAADRRLIDCVSNVTRHFLDPTLNLSSLRIVWNFEAIGVNRVSLNGGDAGLAATEFPRAPLLHALHPFLAACDLLPCAPAPAPAESIAASLVHDCGWPGTLRTFSCDVYVANTYCGTLRAEFGAILAWVSPGAIPTAAATAWQIVEAVRLHARDTGNECRWLEYAVSAVTMGDDLMHLVQSWPHRLVVADCRYADIAADLLPAALTDDRDAPFAFCIVHSMCNFMALSYSGMAGTCHTKVAFRRVYFQRADALPTALPDGAVTIAPFVSTALDGIPISLTVDKGEDAAVPPGSYARHTRAETHDA